MQLRYFQLPRIDVLMIPVCSVLFYLFWRALDRLLFRPVMLLVGGLSLLAKRASVLLPRNAE